MAGLVRIGAGIRDTAMEGLQKAAQLESQTNSFNDAAQQQAKSNRISAAGTGAALGMAAAGSSAAMGAKLGMAAGPVGAVAGAAIGFLASGLF